MTGPKPASFTARCEGPCREFSVHTPWAGGYTH